MYYILFSVIMSIIISLICLKEMSRIDNGNRMYPHITEIDKKLVFLYLILIPLLFKVKGITMFSISFSIIAPILVTQIIIDFREQELSDLLTLIIAIVAISVILKFVIFQGYNPAILYYLANSAILFGVYLLIAIITNGALGGGDIKLIGALGLFFSTNVLCALLISPFVIGAIYALILLVSKKKKHNESFAFGPSIIIGVLIVSLFLL